MEPAVPFTIRDLLPGSARALGPALDAVTGLRTLQRLYRGPRPAGSFADFALDRLGISVHTGDDELARVPVDGPVIIAANHPHGAADGLALIHLLLRIRPDVKLLGNELLARIPEMRGHLVPVDVFRGGRGRNRAAVHGAAEWVRAGHALIVFPAGEVSHVGAPDGRLVDPRWRDGAVRIAAQAGAPVLAAFIEGQNSAWFAAAGRLHPHLRTAMLPRELLRLRGSVIRVRLGQVISSHRLEVLGDAPAQTAYVRLRCYGLGTGSPQRGAAVRVLRRARVPAPIAAEMPASAIAGEIALLPARACLVESGAWSVYCAAGSSIPHTLREIGRLRELTFRAAGEGTGRDRDLDRYDVRYRHLFVWHRQQQVIAGAYRVAPTDLLVAEHGLSALYTRSLFRYPRRLIEELGPALELGRSFVQPAFQRDYQPLLLLWRGIGRLVANEPRYRVLFGPVSISAEYGAVTRQILARFLLANRYSARLGALVRPKRPLPPDPHDDAGALVRSTVASSVDDVDAIVRELEAGQRGIPVLLRQYLKLNAKLLGFSVDPAFGHVLDGLIVVDLLDIERSLLARYLGKDGAAGFLEWHAARHPAAAGRLAALHL